MPGKKLNFLKKYLALILSAAAFIIYLFTLAPSVVQIDSGELAALQITLGIAHPTGYPLYTILGYLFSSIPLPFTKIYQMNLLAAIYCATAVGFFVQSVKLTLDNLQRFNPKSLIETKKQKKKNWEKKEKTLRIKTSKKNYLAQSKLLLLLLADFFSLSARHFGFKALQWKFTHSICS